ncbi:nucleotide-binding alpha-beta plait domain-containing protein [Tanacetum coccineum]
MKNLKGARFRVGLDQVVNTIAFGDRGQGFDPHPYKAGGSFLPLVEPEAAYLPLIVVGLSTSQPLPYTVEDVFGLGFHFFGFVYWICVVANMGDRRSKEDQVQQISTSIYVTNFPDYFSYSDLWKECQEYGRVIDAFIPNRRSKAGNKFGFVCFIHIKDVDHLVRNLCTIWVGHLRLHATVARFQRIPLNKNQNVKVYNEVPKFPTGIPSNSKGLFASHTSYVGAVKNKKEYKQDTKENSIPSLVLEESCFIQYDYSLALKGKVADFRLLTNLKRVLIKEGFDNINLKYLGGFWVLIEFCNKEVLEKFKSHTGVGSWFASLEYASDSFVIDERVVWVDIEGVPMKA